MRTLVGIVGVLFVLIGIVGGGAAGLVLSGIDEGDGWTCFSQSHSQTVDCSYDTDANTNRNLLRGFTGVAIAVGGAAFFIGGCALTAGAAASSRVTKRQAAPVTQYAGTAGGPPYGS